jgi:UPF0755 protein
MERFKMVAGKMSYPSNVKSGGFIDKRNEQLRACKGNAIQCFCKISIHQERIENLAGRVGSQIEADSASHEFIKDSIF